MADHKRRKKFNNKLRATLAVLLISFFSLQILLPGFPFPAFAEGDFPEGVISDVEPDSDEEENQNPDDKKNINEDESEKEKSEREDEPEREGSKTEESLEDEESPKDEEGSEDASEKEDGEDLPDEIADTEDEEETDASNAAEGSEEETEQENDEPTLNEEKPASVTISAALPEKSESLKTALLMKTESAEKSDLEQREEPELSNNDVELEADNKADEPEEEINQEEVFSSRVMLSSAPVPTSENRTIYRFHLSADGLEDSEVNHVLAVILDQDNQAAANIILSAENGWQTDWQTYDANPPYSVLEWGIYDSDGNDVSEDWSSQISTFETGNYQESSTVSEPVDSFGEGIHIISFMEGGTEYLLAASSTMLSNYGLYRWPLTTEWNPPEQASEYAQWIPQAEGDGFYIRNVGIGDNGYLAAGIQSNYKYVFAVIRQYHAEPTVKSFLDNSRLKSTGGGTGYQWLHAATGGISASNEAGASLLNIYRLRSYSDDIHELSCQISHEKNETPVIVKTDVKICLAVNGNMGDREEAFPFRVTVNGEEAAAFTLTHQGEYTLSEIPVGATLEIGITAPDYLITSCFPGCELCSSTLIIPSVPADGGTASFQIRKDIEINTGIRTGNTGIYVLILTIIFLRAAATAVIKKYIRR